MEKNWGDTPSATLNLTNHFQILIANSKSLDVCRLAFKLIVIVV